MGQPMPRIDGRLKVTGGARYPSDIRLKEPVYAALALSSIALGSISRFRLDAARAVAGVIDIFTHETLSDAIKEQVMMGQSEQAGYAASTIRPLQSASILHDGQIIAIVVADTFEAATEAARLVAPEYDARTPSATFGSDGVTIEEAAKISKKHEDPKIGDAEAALRTAEVKVDNRYSTPVQHHNPIELFTTSCIWDGPKLTIFEPSQTAHGLRFGVAQQLGMNPDDVHVVSSFIGGAFGSKGATTERTALIAAIAKKLDRPVKFVSSRADAFFVSTYRAETEQRVALAASRDGKLTALIHEGHEVTSRPDGYFVGGTDTTTRMYACPNISTKVSVVHADRKTPGFMRAPAEMPYMFVLESAMDELAETLGIDPVELRRINDTQIEPIKGLAFTSRSLMPCFDAAAAAFRWSERNRKPGAARDGDWLIGQGCATSCYPTMVAPATARVSLMPDGTAHVETAAQDVGTGTYTVVAQMAAERLGIDARHVKVTLGDSKLPPAPVSGGSNVTASVCSAVAKACDAINEKLRGSNSQNLAEQFRRLGVSELVEYAETVAPGASPEGIDQLYKGISALGGGPKLKDRIQYAFGAQFIEVAVHSRTREIRVRRMTGAFAAGRIMNTRTARSQLMGGMIGGIGSALLEATEIDRRYARYVNKNLADYEVPVNADIEALDVILVPETDDKVNAVGVKGVGELGIVGTAAAVANAVYNATGIRVRDLPIRLDALLT
ncbi:MAG: xanthine dehydrogenase family protein molybdopterin-binding subunit [Beijerinckiaceae bacterium]|nr:xanthine dehydrogenase family protein molybdopterin-binding subunit [Beijerinckiaceae bacterium]